MDNVHRLPVSPPPHKLRDQDDVVLELIRTGASLGSPMTATYLVDRLSLTRNEVTGSLSRLTKRERHLHRKRIDRGTFNSSGHKQSEHAYWIDANYVNPNFGVERLTQRGSNRNRPSNERPNLERLPTDGNEVRAMIASIIQQAGGTKLTVPQIQAKLPPPQPIMSGFMRGILEAYPHIHRAYYGGNNAVYNWDDSRVNEAHKVAEAEAVAERRAQPEQPQAVHRNLAHRDWRADPKCEVTAEMFGTAVTTVNKYKQQMNELIELVICDDGTLAADVVVKRRFT